MEYVCNTSFQIAVRGLAELLLFGPPVRYIVPYCLRMYYLNLASRGNLLLMPRFLEQTLLCISKYIYTCMHTYMCIGVRQKPGGRRNNHMQLVWFRVHYGI